jgi:hypothetical protein
MLTSEQMDQTMKIPDDTQGQKA